MTAQDCICFFIMYLYASFISTLHIVHTFPSRGSLRQITWCDSFMLWSILILPPSVSLMSFLLSTAFFHNYIKQFLEYPWPTIVFSATSFWNNYVMECTCNFLDRPLEGFKYFNNQLLFVFYFWIVFLNFSWPLLIIYTYTIICHYYTIIFYTEENLDWDRNIYLNYYNCAFHLFDILFL